MSLFEFYRLLQRHDWSYNYSDDHRVWQKGMDEANMIQHILKGNSRDEKYRNLYAVSYTHLTLPTKRIV